jgi:hypothetical protein
MISIPLIDELREIRRRLAGACQEDVVRYAQMLQDETQAFPGTRVFKPLLPSTPSRSEPASLSDEKRISQ